MLHKLGKKKWLLTMICTVVGTFIAVRTNASLGEWSVFALAIIGSFGAADVTDKKLNGGRYDEREEVTK